MSIKLKGSSDGSVSLDAPADTSPTGTDVSLTLPTSAGSANQFLKNGSTAGELEHSSMVEDSSGKVGIGTTSPAQTLEIASTAPNIRFTDTIDGHSEIDGNAGSLKLNADKGNEKADTTITFFVDNSEKLRITSGGALNIGGSSFSAGNNGVSLLATGSQFFRSGTSSRTHITFNNNNGSVGSITTSGTSTAFNTSSDYRLKENVVNLDGAIDRVKQLAPKRFNFIADADTTVDGFLAHEAQTVVPEAVTGTHNEVDDDGNPVYQGIDQSKLVPLLTAALQEAIAEIETLKTKVAALEAAS